MAWRRPAYEARAVLATADRVAVGFALHDLELLPTEAEDRVVGHLGPDLLDPGVVDAHAAEALRRFTARRDHELGLVLLEQRVMAGVGNLYKAEVCFLRGCRPWTPVRDVPDPARADRRWPASCCCATRTGPSSRPPGSSRAGASTGSSSAAGSAAVAAAPGSQSASRATGCTRASRTGARAASRARRPLPARDPRPCRPLPPLRPQLVARERADAAHREVDGVRECLSWCRAAAPGG